MSAEPLPPHLDELYTLHALDQLLACLEDACTTLRRIQAQYPQFSDPNLDTTLALITRMQQQLAPLTGSRPLP